MIDMSGLTAVSLFAGIEGIGLALERAGVDVVASVEIDPDCRGVIARHFPETTLFDDVRTVTGDQLRAAGFVPERGIMAGGWPCQDLSIAGRRSGLGGARSGLFWEIVRLATELRPRWLLLENVDDLLSSACPCPGDGSCVDNGRAVRCGRLVKGEWQSRVQHNPPGGVCRGGCMAVHGGAMGAVVGALEQLGYGLCWRVLDAQYAGVPQRRERLFFAGCLGDGAAPVQVLLEPESSERDFAARSPARQGTPGRAHDGAGGPGAVASTVQGGGRRGHRIDAEGAAGGHLIPFDLAQITSPENRANPQPGDPAPPLNRGGGVHVTATPFALRGREEGARLELGREGDPAFTLRAANGGSSHGMVAYALTSRNDRNDRNDREQTWVAHALTSEGHDASEDGDQRRAASGPVLAGVVSQPMAFNPQTGGSKARLGYGEIPTSLSCTQATGVHSATGVRRLTPKERERLQGFPDDWTRWRLQDGRLVEQSDSARDRQTGNSVAVPVVEWITRRIVAVDASLVAAALEEAV